ncbi:hypothetical protein F4808DRAFT_435332 [Astrocystis sublimbata]|nr:hypothetical protein F4808DRAFT_435332 [Astrocystis sublimbata]
MHLISACSVSLHLAYTRIYTLASGVLSYSDPWSTTTRLQLKQNVREISDRRGGLNSRYCSCGIGPGHIHSLLCFSSWDSLLTNELAVLTYAIFYGPPNDL